MFLYDKYMTTANILHFPFLFVYDLTYDSCIYVYYIYIHHTYSICIHTEAIHTDLYNNTNIYLILQQIRICK